jgi:hypothetical protein
MPARRLQRKHLLCVDVENDRPREELLWRMGWMGEGGKKLHGVLLGWMRLRSLGTMMMEEAEMFWFSRLASLQDGLAFWSRDSRRSVLHRGPVPAVHHGKVLSQPRALDLHAIKTLAAILLHRRSWGKRPWTNPQCRLHIIDFSLHFSRAAVCDYDEIPMLRMPTVRGSHDLICPVSTTAFLVIHLRHGLSAAPPCREKWVS